MKALILAGGLGTRLRPLTLSIAKPLVPIGGKPLLQHHLDRLQAHGIHDILVNTHYLPEQIERFVAEYLDAHTEVSITTTHEPELLGSAGTVRANRDFFDPGEDFLVVYGDNFTDISYAKLLERHREGGGIVTIACYVEDHPEEKGMVEFDAGGIITRFVEKPKAGETTSRFANGGIYAAQGRLHETLATLDHAVLDFGHHVFPHLLERGESLVAYPMTEMLLDIGTPEMYERAQHLA